MQTSTATSLGTARGAVAKAGGAAFASEPSRLAGEVADERDRSLAIEAAQHALDTVPNGTSVGWKNPDNGHEGSITPMHTYQALGGGECREYESTTTIE